MGPQQATGCHELFVGKVAAVALGPIMPDPFKTFLVMVELPIIWVKDPSDIDKHDSVINVRRDVSCSFDPQLSMGVSAPRDQNVFVILQIDFDMAIVFGPHAHDDLCDGEDFVSVKDTIMCDDGIQVVEFF
jgi:hypothetical protein